MKFYRTFTPFKVISFDLDDTLYDNFAVILQTEAKFVESLREVSQIAAIDSRYWRSWKNRIEQKKPLLCEDVTQWRIEAMTALLHFHGKSAVETEQIIAQSMAVFMQWRHKISVPPQSTEVLDRLKKRYKLAALSNGNVDPRRIGFQQFDLILRGGAQGRAKPHRDLFHRTAAHYAVRPDEILHVGDNLTTDVQGAINAGCQAVWINLSARHLAQFSEARVLPTAEIGDLTELLALA